METGEWRRGEVGMNFKDCLRGIGRMLLAVLAGAVGFFLLTLGMKGKQSLEVKEVEIDEDKIRADERGKIMDMPSDDFATEFPGVGDAAERGKKRFSKRVKGLLQHLRGGNTAAGNGSGSDTDCRGRN